jgi:hypothetical protein
MNKGLIITAVLDLQKTLLAESDRMCFSLLTAWILFEI